MIIGFLCTSGTQTMVTLQLFPRLSGSRPLTPVIFFRSVITLLLLVVTFAFEALFRSLPPLRQTFTPRSYKQREEGKRKARGGGDK